MRGHRTKTSLEKRVIRRKTINKSKRISKKYISRYLNQISYETSQFVNVTSCHITVKHVTRTANCLKSNVIIGERIF